jgi:dihydroorotate dehydrogenase (NAD+) catalytic subunit
MQVDLRIKIGGVTFPNPVLLGSGPLGRNAWSMAVMAKAGAGGIVTKTISLQAREGSPHPRVFSPTPFVLVNSSGGPNPGLYAFQEIIHSAKKEIAVPIVGSLAARSLDELQKLAPGIAGAGAELLELNFKTLAERDHPEKFLSSSIQAVKSEVGVPVGAKLASHYPAEVTILASIAQEAGADFLTLINTVPALAIDIETFRPRLGNPMAAYYSGPAVKPLAVKCIAEAARAVNIPILGVGGCAKAEDAIEMMLAGARAVQVCTAAMIRGPAVFQEILSGMVDYLVRKGIPRAEDLCGKALLHLSGRSLSEDFHRTGP